METREFLVVNAFATQAFGGNPAAVFLDAAGLSDEQMQAIARQMNLVETVFVLPAKMESWDVELRYFTPDEELPVAGHPTIAAWLALVYEDNIDASVRSEFTQKTKAGIQKIQIQMDRPPCVVMEQPTPKFLGTLSDRSLVVAVLGVKVDDLDDNLPIEAIDTGLGHLIVPFRNLDGLMHAQRHIDELMKLSQAMRVRELQIFCFETINNDADLHTRNLCPREGLEDPACGTGNGALAAYLLKNYFRDKKEIKVRAEQGHIVKMPSLITAIARQSENHPMEIFVSGPGKVMIKGRFYL